MPQHKLTTDEIDKHLQELPGWRVENDTLIKQFEFATFVKAIEFVNILAESAEEIQHHPDIDIRYNKVTVGLSTHDAGGLTVLDTDFAASADTTADAL